MLFFITLVAKLLSSKLLTFWFLNLMSLNYLVSFFLLFQTSHHKSSHLTLVHRFDFNLHRKLDNTVSFLVPFAYIFISPFYFTLPFRPFSTDHRLVCCWVPSWLSARISPGSSPCTLLNAHPLSPFTLGISFSLNFL